MRGEETSFSRFGWFSDGGCGWVTSGVSAQVLLKQLGTFSVLNLPINSITCTTSVPHPIAAAEIINLPIQ